MAGPTGRRRWARGAAVVFLVAVGLLVAGSTWWTDSFGVSWSTLPYAMVGTSIVWQRPRARIGWVLLAFALLWSATFFGAGLAAHATSDRLVLVAAWLSEWTWFPALVSVFVVLPILFPTGMPPGPRWKAVLWFAAVICVGFVVLTSIQARFSPDDSLVVTNPWRLLDIQDAEAWLVPGAVPLLVLGPTAAVIRFRRSQGVERQQIRWFMYAAVACGFMFAANATVDALTRGRAQTLTEAAFVVALSLPPLGIWIAVTRHHLYDIDRLISRTVAYGVLTALLAGLYVLSIFVLGAIIPVEGDLPVAGSTLVVAAVSNPLRRRIQDTVDRRFNRARYDARRFVESFSRRLRVEGDLEAIGAELEGAVAFTMEPTSFSLWLRNPDTDIRSAAPGPNDL